MRLLTTGGDEFLDGQTNVLSDLTKQNRRNVAARVDGDGSNPAVWVPELLVGATLPNFLKTESLKQGDDFARLEDRWFDQLSDRDGLNAYELGLKLRRAILQ